MCYLIAKRIDEVGCIALRTSHGKHLAEFKRLLVDMVGYESVQLVTISKPSAYAEYEPYQFANTMEEFPEMANKLHNGN